MSWKKPAVSDENTGWWWQEKQARVEQLEAAAARDDAEKKALEAATLELKSAESFKALAKSKGAKVSSIRKVAQAERFRRNAASDEVISVAGAALRPSDPPYNLKLEVSQPQQHQHKAESLFPTQSLIIDGSCRGQFCALVAWFFFTPSSVLSLCW
jgi:hypothetical protein